MRNRIIFGIFLVFFSCLLQDDLPRVEPLEINKCKDEVKDGGGDDEDGKLPAQPGQQVEGLVLIGESSEVVVEVFHGGFRGKFVEFFVGGFR